MAARHPGLCGYSRRISQLPWRKGVKRQWGCRERQFSAFSLATFSETLEILRPALLHSDTQSVVGFSVIPKCMTLNDLKRLFRVKLHFAQVWLALNVRLSKNNCVKTNKDIHILSAS